MSVMSLICGRDGEPGNVDGSGVRWKITFGFVCSESGGDRAWGEAGPWGETGSGAEGIGWVLGRCRAHDDRVQDEQWVRGTADGRLKSQNKTTLQSESS